MGDTSYAIGVGNQIARSNRHDVLSTEYKQSIGLIPISPLPNGIISMIMATATPAPQQIVVAYAKVVEDKEDGIYVQGVFFGGIATTKEEAEQLARDCVNSVKGGTILPRLIHAPGEKANVLAAMDVAAARFHQIERQMFDAEEIYERTQGAQSRNRNNR